MTTYFEIPLSPEAQTFTIALAGTTYQFSLIWNVTNASWVIDIADASGNKILCGIPMVTGGDLLEQFGYLGFGFQLLVQTDNDPAAVPTFVNLGTTGHLYAAVSN